MVSTLQESGKYVSGKKYVSCRKVLNLLYEVWYVSCREVECCSKMVSSLQESGKFVV